MLVVVGSGVGVSWLEVVVFVGIGGFVGRGF